MQRFFILVLVSLLCLNKNIAQQEGIYLTTLDFSIGKLSYQKTKEKKYKLKVNSFPVKPTIQIKSGDSIISLKKDSVFGYRDKKNNCHRFYNNEDYLILNPAEKLLLYSSTSPSGYKNLQTTTDYFFSLSANSPVYKLSKQNLKFVLANNKIFLQLLDVYFNADEALSEYDNTKKIYKLNKIEKLSEPKTIK